MERREESEPEWHGRVRRGDGGRAPRRGFLSQPAGQGARRPVLPASPPTRRPGLARREAFARSRQQWRAARSQGVGGEGPKAPARRPATALQAPREGRRARGPRNDAVERGASRGPEAAGRTVCSGRGSRPVGGHPSRQGSVQAAVSPGSAARAPARTYLVELFAHIRVNVYVVHAVRHLPSASAAAAAAASCRSARRGSSSGSGGGGGAAASLPRPERMRRGWWPGGRAAVLAGSGGRASSRPPAAAVSFVRRVWGWGRLPAWTCGDRLFAWPATSSERRVSRLRFSPASPVTLGVVSPRAASLSGVLPLRRAPYRPVCMPWGPRWPSPLHFSLLPSAAGFL